MADQGGLSPAARRLAAGVAAELPDVPVMVALSGGADSAALAWAIRQTDRPARAVSIDHGLDGSAELMQAAAAIAGRLDLEHQIIRVDQATDSETDLRVSRLAALVETCRDGEVIVTAHTRNDQAETVLGNVLRGAGTTGLAGIPVRRGPFLRPMLAFDRPEARSVATELGLPFVDDPQNEDMSIRRNRLRARTIPDLAADYNPGVVEALARLGSAAAGDDDLLEARAANVPVRCQNDEVLIPAASLVMLPDAVAARVARRALRMVGGPHAGEAREVAAILSALAGHETTISQGIQVLREGPWVVLAGSRQPVIPAATLLDPGSSVAFGGWEVFAARHGTVLGRSGAVVGQRDPMFVRAPSRGDRIAIRGGSKAVGDVLSEASIPPRLRSQWPVIEAGGTIVWVAGIRAAPVSEGSETVVVRAVRRRP